MPTRDCSTCSWRYPSYADASCREPGRIQRWKGSWHLSNEQWPASCGRDPRPAGRASTRPYTVEEEGGRSAGSPPRVPTTSSPPTAQRRGKGGPQAHPAGTRSALPAAGAVGEVPAGVGRVLSSGEGPRRLLRQPQSAHSPQMVRKTPRNGQHRPTGFNDKCAGQPSFSFTAHRAKPPLGRFCKAGVRGSIPPVSTSPAGP